MVTSGNPGCRDIDGSGAVEEVEVDRDSPFTGSDVVPEGACRGVVVDTSTWASVSTRGPSLTCNVTIAGALSVGSLSRPGDPSSRTLTLICAVDTAKGSASWLGRGSEDLASNEGRNCGVVIHEDAME